MRTPTPTEIARARYDEATAIKAAWWSRVAKAQHHHREATRDGGDTLTTKRELNAAEIGYADATEQHRVAQQIWVDEANKALWRNRKVS